MVVSLGFGCGFGNCGDGEHKFASSWANKFRLDFAFAGSASFYRLSAAGLRIAGLSLFDRVTFRRLKWVPAQIYGRLIVMY